MSKRISVGERLKKETKKQDPVDELIKSTSKQIKEPEEDLWELKRQTYYVPKIVIDALGFKKLMEDKDISEIVREALEENIEDKYLKMAEEKYKNK